MREALRGQRLIAAAVLAFLLFNFPFLALFDRPVLLFGLPLLWAYLLGAWVLVIALVAWTTRGS
ncbi:MAG: hypothetical protein M3P46_00390 [Actinomycetota bacterium]|nr:hypothetical protein [Actinomycetota bacterium]